VNQADLLRHLLGVLETQKLAYLLVGSFASAAYYYCARSRPFAADEVFQIDADSPQPFACSFDVRLAGRSDALLPVLDFVDCRLDEGGA